MLDEILYYKKEEVRDRKSLSPLKELKARLREQASPRGFQDALTRPSPVHLIAEVKKASPSKGIIRADFDPIAIARIYQEGGACTLSVLTDERFFQGHLSLLGRIKEAVRLPVLQKDFILSDYQIYEARVFDADAVLLIAAVLDRLQMADYYALAKDLGMDVLCEVHTEKELERVVDLAEVIGINNRDLTTFQTNLETTFRIAAEVPDGKIVVSESGIHSRREVLRLQEAGVDAMLVGESLLRAADIGAKLRELLGGQVDPDREGEG